jgi:hypothetical protein
MGLVVVDTEVVQLDLRLRPRQSDYPLKGRGVMIFVGQRQGFIARCRDQRRKCDAGSGAGRQPHPVPETDDRIKHRADGVGQWEAVDNRHRGAYPTPAAKKPGAVGLVLHTADGLAFNYHYVCGPDLRFVVGARAAGREQRVECGDEVGLHKQVRKRGVGGVGRGRSEYDFGVGSKFDLAGPRP